MCSLLQFMLVVKDIRSQLPSPVPSLLLAAMLPCYSRLITLEP